MAKRDISNSWVPASGKKPEDFDLVLVATSKGKECPAWWSGTRWEGLRLRKDDVVMAYKRYPFQTYNASDGLTKERKKNFE